MTQRTHQSVQALVARHGFILFQDGLELTPQFGDLPPHLPLLLLRLLYHLVMLRLLLGILDAVTGQ